MPQPFPHLKPAEGLLWAAFLRLHGAEWDRFDYDVKVGQGHPIPADAPDYIKAMIRKLSPKRIDVVGYLGDHPTIFEVNPRGGRVVVGACLLYRYLYRQTFPQIAEPACAAVVGRLDPDVGRFLASQGVTVYVVEGVLASFFGETLV